MLRPALKWTCGLLVAAGCLGGSTFAVAANKDSAKPETDATVTTNDGDVKAAAPTKKKPARKQTGPITKPKFDPNAKEVGLFEAKDAEQVGVKLVMHNAKQGNLLLENNTDEPLNIKLPDAMVGIGVHAQFGGGMMGGGMGGMGGGGMGGMGGGQAVGGGGGMGGMGGGGMGGGGMGGMGGGGGFFGGKVVTVPANRTVSIKFSSVCLEHGKPEPSPRSRYTVIPVEQISDSPELKELLTMVSNNQVDKQAAQAAAWHITNNMSWDRLAAEANTDRFGGKSPYFSREELLGGQALFAESKARALEKAEAGEQPAARQPASARDAAK